MMIAKPITTGTWAKTARKTYRHESGIVVRYVDNKWAWTVIGGKHDGFYFGTLSAAQSAVSYALTH